MRVYRLCQIISLVAVQCSTAGTLLYINNDTEMKQAGAFGGPRLMGHSCNWLLLLQRSTREQDAPILRTTVGGLVVGNRAAFAVANGI
jgi:hypothetical protein